MKYFWTIILSFTLLILAGKYLLNGELLFRLEENIRTVLFQIVSIMTTTGYGTQDVGSAYFPAAARQLFLVLMLIGGCIGSTSGGIKVMRVAILNHLFFREIRKIYYPRRAALPVTFDQQIVEKNEVLKIAALFFGWLFLIITGSLITSLFSDLSAFQSLSGMMSALGNIGPFYFSVEKMASLHPVIKLTYIFGMLAGRLEILPIMILFARRSWSRN